MRIDYRWSDGDVNRMQIFAKELAALTPDAILAHTTPVTAALQRETRTIPIVFVVVGDPVGEGFVAGLSHPGGNITGFSYAEGAFAGKMLELLTEIAPTVTLDHCGIRRGKILRSLWWKPETATAICRSPVQQVSTPCSKAGCRHCRQTGM
jgi:hypothetical protein